VVTRTSASKSIFEIVKKDDKAVEPSQVYVYCTADDSKPSQKFAETSSPPLSDIRAEVETKTPDPVWLRC
jgi:hypothetical protein